MHARASGSATALALLALSALLISSASGAAVPSATPLLTSTNTRALRSYGSSSDSSSSSSGWSWGHHSSSWGRPTCPPPAMGAVYTMSNSNDYDGNMILAVPMDPATGTLMPQSIMSVPTLGYGAPGNASDRLFSQGAIKVVGNLLFAVNAGSNTLSVFTIDPRDPTKLTQLGLPRDTKGQFPISVDYNANANLACVLNGGNANGVTCFMVDPMHGLMPNGIQVRSLPVRALATPPMGPFNTYSQILFSNDGNELVVIFKGDPMNPGFIATFMVDGYSMLSQSAVVTTTPGVLFGSAFRDPYTLIVSDPTAVARQFDMLDDGTVHQTAMTMINGTRAVCWASYSVTTDTVLLADAGLPVLIQVDSVTLQVTQTLDLSAALGRMGGLFDIDSPSQFAFALVAGTGRIVAIDLGLNPGNMTLLQATPANTVPMGSQGIAVYMPDMSTDGSIMGMDGMNGMDNSVGMGGGMEDGMGDDSMDAGMNGDGMDAGMNGNGMDAGMNGGGMSGGMNGGGMDAGSIYSGKK